MLAILESPVRKYSLLLESQFSSYLPLGGSQLSLASALGDNSLLLFQASADDTGRDREVLVVAKESSVSKIFLRRIDDDEAVGRQLTWKLMLNIPDASLLPGESHFDSRTR